MSRKPLFLKRIPNNYGRNSDILPNKHKNILNHKFVTRKSNARSKYYHYYYQKEESDGKQDTLKSSIEQRDHAELLGSPQTSKENQHLLIDGLFEIAVEVPEEDIG